MKIKNSYTVIGMMSGTSLDGLDIACCTFRKVKSGWTYTIEKATTLSYSATWLKNLSNAHTLSGEDLLALNAAYGKFLGEACNKFVTTHSLRVDFIASHGHTIFHQPDRGFTYQLGNGTSLHAVTGLPVVSDFRSLDVTLGGEGAPLVPAGDKFLFSEYDVCLNLGGIANLSMDVKRQRIAYDICFMNMGLNYLAAKAGKKYDAGGAMAASGSVNASLLKSLTRVYDAMRNKRPSLGREIFEKKVQPLLDRNDISLNDRMHTVTLSSADEIARAITTHQKQPKVLCTGGGAFNSFFISQLLDKCGDNAELILPDEDIISFKEAMVFAFLGVLRVEGEVNCLKSVTGASRNSSAGVINE